ncbi:MAG: PAS domain-containing protein [Candidatus Paracaedibacteraceae bacterium]|nr:PAS domain-containing protein [Candidatus Paracaedibacteraceae bacterium]
MQTIIPPPFDKTMIGSSCYALLKYFHHPAWIRLVDGRYVWVNQSFLNFFKVKLEQVIDKRNEDFLSPEIAEKSSATEQEVIEKRCSVTFHFEREDCRATVHKTPIFSDNNEIIAVAAVMVDLTQELELETQLACAKDFYEILLTNMGEALFFINKNNEFEIVNKRGQEALKDLGFKGPLNFKSWDSFFSERYGTDGKKYTEDMKIIPRAWKGEVILNEEVCVERKKGCKITFLASAIPFRSKTDNSIHGIILTVTDITKEKELLNNLAQKTKLIEQRNQELNQFAYSAAHDLRDPLRSISLLASFIEEKLKKQDYEEVEFLLQKLLNTAAYGGSLVKNLLDYSAANREIKMETVCLHDVVDHTINTLSNLIEQAEGKIIFNNLPTVLGNDQQLQIVFQNIISNAIRYKGDAPLSVSISAEQENSLWVISVQDNGSGISEEFKEEIFLPFKRLKANVHSRSSGLGLSICRRIIEQHGGKIWLDTLADRGACFKFTLKGVPKK